MKIIKKNEQSLLIKTFGIRDKLYLATSVIIFFDLNEPDTPLKEQDLWTMLPEQLGQGFIFDQGMLKPRGEVLVTGKCYAPRGMTRQASQIALRVGDLEKRLAVFGNRYWETIAGTMKRITAPEPFSEMPVTWQNAFGGPEVEKNPVGKGLAETPMKDLQLRIPLPNIEDPKHLIGSPSDRPEPAGLGPLDLTWPQRQKKTGTYDDKWLRERWPHFPEDMNYEFFNAAPEDQFIQGFFTGNESIEIANMHPDIPLIQSRLPRLRMRCFILKRTSLKPDQKEEVFLELENRIDTVWLFPSVLRGVAIYRGTAEVLDDEYADIVRMYFDMEKADEQPRSIDFYYEELQKAFSRAVPIDSAPLEEAKKKIKAAMLLVKNLPKELDAIKKKVLGKSPVMLTTPEEAAARAKKVIQDSMGLVSRMEGMVADMQTQYAHIVKIDDKVDFDGIRQKLISTDKQIDKTMARAKEARKQAAGVQKNISEILKQNIRPDLLEKSGVDPDNLLPERKGVNPWHDQGFPFVVQCRKNLESFPPALESFQKIGLSRKTIERYWLGINPEERKWDRTAWGLGEKKDRQGNAEALSLPAGLVIPRFHEAMLNRLLIRASHYSDSRKDILVEGSDATPLFLGASVMEEDTPCVRVADDLEAMLVEQEAGDACCVVSLKAAADKPGKDAAGIMERAKVFLIVLCGDEDKAEAEWREWRKAYGNAQKLLLPGHENILEAGKNAFDIRGWIMKALPKDFAEKHSIEPEFPELGKAPDKAPFKTFAIPQLDIKGLVSSLTDEIKAAVQPQVDAAMAMKKETEEKAKAALLKFGKDEGAIAATVAEQSKKSISDVGDHIVDSLMKNKEKLKSLGVLTPDKEKQMDDAAAMARRMAQEGETRYRDGMAQLDSARQAAAKAKAGGIPDFVKEKFKGTGIDPEKIRKLTREEVISMHEKGESLSGAIVSEVDLSELDLSGIDLSSAQCQKTKFMNSNLEGAKLDQVLAMEADFSGACLRSAKAEKGIFTKAVFKKADMRDGQFDSSIFTEADFTGALCDRIRLHMSVLKQARLVKASFPEADIHMCILSGAEATGAVFRGARLEKCVFMDASLDDVDFSSAGIHSTLFHGGGGRNVTFAGANMDKARMGGHAMFPRADLRNIRMKHGCLMDSDLSGAVFTGSVIEESLIENCNLQNAQMERVSARKTRLKGSNLENARMGQINLFQGSLRKARLTGADLSGGNLYGVDMYKSTVGNTRFNGANLKMTLLQKKGGSPEMTRVEILALIHRNETVAGVRLAGLDLSGADLTGGRFENVSFTGARLCGVNIRKTGFTGCDFSGACLDDTDLSRVNLSNMGFEGASLKNVTFDQTIVNGADLAGADLSGSKVNMTIFQKARLEGANLSGVAIRKSVFLKTSLRKANFSQSDLVKTGFLEADVSGVDFRGAKFFKVLLSKCKLPGQDFRGCAFQQVNCSNSDLSGADFTGADVTMCNFMETDLTGAKFRAAVGRNTMFMGAILKRSSLRKGDFRQSYFGEADLTEADFSDMDLQNCVFERATCRKTDFTLSRCNYADYSYADLTEADFALANLTLARMHMTNENKARWNGADRTLLRGTDKDMAEAETWSPPPKQK